MKKLLYLTFFIVGSILSTFFQDTKVIPKTESPSYTLSSTTTSKNISTKVIRVIDGDTLIASINGKEERIRLIGVNTPETVDPRRLVGCFGKEASNEAKRILTAEKSIRLETDPSQGERDKYERFLAYVFIDDHTNFNQLMIENGYGYEYTYTLPYKYQKEFKQAQEEARENKRGLWADGVCDNN